MDSYRLRQALLGALVLPGVLCGCAAYRAYEKCGSGGCPGDAAITAAVRAHFDEHTELKAPSLLYVRTLDGVVYLSGQVATDLQRETAEELARQVPGVRRVCDIISLGYNGR
ncbi:MAG TPA: BON domain-containing protein [Steroidobacteraceae bacterium]|nr:BON domain-containing protein [Steroidobacteraceae bacterium]